ncbi:MAG: YceI family protein [Alphaproteobacteria bacterium]
MRTRILTPVIATLLTVGLATSADAFSQDASTLPAGAYDLDTTHASLIWKVSHMGLSNYAARFTRFDVDLEFDPANPANSTVNATIDPTSIETDYPFPEKKDFDAKLVNGADWFNAGEFTQITFKSTALQVTGDTTGTMTGDLTFLGVTKPVTLDVTFNGGYGAHPMNKRPALGFSATGSLKRSDWGFDTYVPNIGDMVELQIEAEFTQAE